MCHCTPSIKTPWCGKPGCEPPSQDKPKVEPATADPVFARSDFDPGLACLAMLLGEDYDTTAARLPFAPGEPVPPTQEQYFVWWPDIVWAAAQADVAITLMIPREQHKKPSLTYAPTGGDLWKFIQGRKAILLVSARRQEGRVTYLFWDGEKVIDPQSRRRPANHYPEWERPEMLEAMVVL